MPTSEADLRERMKGQSTEELVRACTLEAGDYTPEALAIAREEITSRGEDASKLVPAPKTEAPDAPERLGGTLMILGLVLAAFSAPWIGELPRPLGIAIESAAVALLVVGGHRVFRSRGASP